MYAKAMRIVELTGDSPNRLSTYDDADQVAEWSYDSVRSVLSAKVFNGKTSKLLDPKGQLSNAEAITAINNLLKAAKLIQS